MMRRHKEAVQVLFSVLRSVIIFKYSVPSSNLVIEGLPAEVMERFLWRAYLIVHYHPLVSCNNLI